MEELLFEKRVHKIADNNGKQNNGNTEVVAWNNGIDKYQQVEYRLDEHSREERCK
jgi:hypothetical protein